MKFYIAKHFKRQLEKLQKKYPKIKQDLIQCLANVQLTNETHIGRSIYKIRIKSSDINKGKSAGLRSYIYFYKRKTTLVPLCIYPKSQKGSITETELQYHFNRVNEELVKTLNKS